MSRPLKFVFSGGGTGGHIFPAVAIANEVKKMIPDAEILFIGAEGRMEMEKVPAAGYRIEGLWISGFQRKNVLKNISLPWKLFSSFMKVRKILKQFQPDVAVGTGGFASGPALRVAASMGIPTLIQEQNSFPGITNKMLSKKVNRICVAFEGMEDYFPKEKIILTGNPVRQDILDTQSKKEEGLRFFDLDPSRFTVLVVGGSLGARTINNSIREAAGLLEKHNIQVLWQTGKAQEAEIRSFVGSSTLKHIHAHTFISRMDLAYAVADAVVSRAGAISVSELCITGKPVILVPSPNVAEDHQTKNAMALVNRNAAMLVKDSVAVEVLGKELLSLAGNNGKRNELSGNIRKLAKPGATKEIANYVITLAKQHAGA